MKKLVYTLALVAGIGLSLSSCKKEEPKTEVDMYNVDQSEEKIPVDHVEVDGDKVDVVEDTAVVEVNEVTKEN